MGGWWGSGVGGMRGSTTTSPQHGVLQLPTTHPRNGFHAQPNTPHLRSKRRASWADMPSMATRASAGGGAAAGAGGSPPAPPPPPAPAAAALGVLAAEGGEPGVAAPSVVLDSASGVSPSLRSSLAACARGRTVVTSTLARGRYDIEARQGRSSTGGAGGIKGSAYRGHFLQTVHKVEGE
jgi:hypothetical protein